MNQNSRVRRFVNEIGIVLSSIYLTFLVDAYALNTTLKRVFVFIYFITMCHVFCALKRRVINKYSISMIIKIIAAGCIIHY